MTETCGRDGRPRRKNAGERNRGSPPRAPASGSVPAAIPHPLFGGGRRGGGPAGKWRMAAAQHRPQHPGKIFDLVRFRHHAAETVGAVIGQYRVAGVSAVSYTHLRAHETVL